MSSSNELKIGSILSYAQMGLGIIIGLIYTPVMIKLLGQSEYGLYNTVSSTISMLSILSLGFNSSYIRYYAIYKEKNEKVNIYKLNGLFLLLFTTIGAIALVCGLFLTSHLELVFDKGLTSSEYTTARILMLLLTINLTFSFPMSVFSNIISAHEKFIFLKIVSIISTVISPLVTLPLLLMGYRSVAIVIVSVSLSFITYIINAIYVCVVLKNKFYFYHFPNGICKSLFKYTIFIAINIIIDQINWNIDKMLLGRFVGTTAVAVYSVGYALYSYYMSFSLSISSVFTPRIHVLVTKTKNNIEEQRVQLTNLFIKVGRIQFLVLGLVASCVLFFGKEFIENIWAGKDYTDSYYVALLLIFSASIALIQNLGIEIQRAQNKHAFRSYAYLVMAIINLLLSIYLCKRYGAIGSAIGTAVSLIIANGVVINIYYHFKCNINIIEFWSNIIIMFKGLIIPVFIGILIKNLRIIDNNLMLFICIGIYIVVYVVSMWCLAMNSYEKDLILVPLKKIIRGSKHDSNKG